MAEEINEMIQCPDCLGMGTCGECGGGGRCNWGCVQHNDDNPDDPTTCGDCDYGDCIHCEGAGYCLRCEGEGEIEEEK